MYNLLEETGRIDTAWQVSPFWVGLPPLRGIGLLIPVLHGFSVLGVVPPRGGFPPSDEPVGRYPTIHHHPKNKTTNPAEGVTPETPTTKNPPFITTPRTKPLTPQRE